MTTELQRLLSSYENDAHAINAAVAIRERQAAARALNDLADEIERTQDADVEIKPIGIADLFDFAAFQVKHARRAMVRNLRSRAERVEKGEA